MSLFHLLRVEAGRLLRDRLTLFALAVTALGPLVGLWGSQVLGDASSVNAALLLVPALAGALAGAAAFAALTALEMDRVHRAGVDVLAEAVASPLLLDAARVICLLFAALLVQLAVMALFLPYTALQAGAVFRPGLYAAVYLTVMLPAMALSVLFTAAAYQITRRLDLTLALFAAFALLSLTAFSENWLLRWINPALSYLSDDFGNVRRLRAVGWNRLFWLLALGGAWLFSLLCVRRYGRGLLPSLARNARRIALPAAALALAALSAAAYVGQPFLDHSKLEFDLDASYVVEGPEDVGYRSIHVDARPNLTTGCMWGEETLALSNRSGKECTVQFKVNPGYRIRSATANGVPVAVRDLADDDLGAKTVEVDLPAQEEIELVLSYGGFPQEWNILSLIQGEYEVSRDYIYLVNQTFAPVPKNISWATEGLPPYTAEITLPEGMTPVLFGHGRAERIGEAAGGARWRLETEGATLLLYAGDYVSRSVDAAGERVDLYYSGKHERVMREYDVEGVLSDVFAYCTEHYGPLKFSADGGLKLIEIGGAGGGYAGRGSSVMSEDSFSEQGFKDPRKGAGGREVLAHEIIHQWWGLGNMFDAADADGAWSAEGLTVYTTYRLMKEKYGAAYAQEHYVDAWRAETDRYYKNYYVRHPELLDRLPEQYRARIHNSLRGMRQYSQMPLMILEAERLVGGEAQMDGILRGLFTRDIDPSYPYLTEQDFLDACGLTKEALRIA